MHRLRSALNRGLLAYGAAFPYHPGKWRLIETIGNRFHLERLYADKAFVVSRRGITWKLRPDDLVQRSIYYFACFEAKETREFSKLVKPDWTFFDVGAYFGYYSLLVSRLSGGRATVHAFEPFSSNYELLLEHAALNGYTNIQAHQLAISDRCGEVLFRLPTPSACQGSGSLMGERERPAMSDRLETVRATSLDRFVAQHDVRHVDFIKVDTEGAEVGVLLGAEDTIRRFRPSLMVEVNTVPEPAAAAGLAAGCLLLVKLDRRRARRRLTRTASAAKGEDR